MLDIHTLRDACLAEGMAALSDHRLIEWANANRALVKLFQDFSYLSDQ